MNDEKKHPDPDFNAILDKVEEMIKSGTLEELLLVAAPGDAADLVRIALEQDAMGGIEHIDDEKAESMKLDPEAAERIHGKPGPKVWIETYGCQMDTKNTTSEPFQPNPMQSSGGGRVRFLTGSVWDRH